MTAVQRLRADEIFESVLLHERCGIHRAFFIVLGLQWTLAIALAVMGVAALHGPHFSFALNLGLAIVGGGVLAAFPVWLIVSRPGDAITRHSIAASQMLWSALLIHLTGGRIETHFHIFGSLAFLAFYRDWRILVTAAVVVTVDHAARGLWMPHSVFGMNHGHQWRVAEHVAWVGFEEWVLIQGCLRGLREMKAMAEREASLEGVNATIEREVQAKTAALSASIQASRRITAVTNSVPWEMCAKTLTLLYVSSQASRVFGLAKASLVGQPFDWNLVHPDDRDRARREFQELAAGRAGKTLETEFRVVLPPENRLVYLRCIVSLHEENGEPSRLLGVTRDITAMKKMELELRHAQKLESVGRLAAGVAHEINTPVQFVSDSVHFVRDSARDLAMLIGRYRGIVDRLVGAGAPAEAAAEARQAEEEADLEYTLEHLPKALDRSLEGLDRVATIVRSMKEFAHPDRREMTVIDLNQAIRSTLTIARHEYKYVADVETSFGELPLVRCHPSDINQVVLNIVVNAAHAIEDVVREAGGHGTIIVRTWLDGSDAVIAISDTGPGVPESAREHLFDPFFTTKGVGKGTGQGLALARTLIVERHGGALSFDTVAGKGTTFTVRLPIDGVRPAEAA